MSDFKAAMRDRVLVFDGAMGTYLQGFGLKPGDFDGHEGLNEILSVSRPDIIKKVHLDYLEAGADVVETNTFGANAAVLAEYGLEGRVTEFNLAAARLAREAADKFSAAKPRFVAGSIGPTNKALFVTGGMSFDDMRALYLDQMLALIEGGVDLLMVETAHDAVNLRAALAAARLAFAKSGRELPVIASATMDGKSKMLSGHDSDSFYAAVGHFPLAAIGFNCSSGPEGMRPRLERLAARAHFPTLVMPNAGLPDENGVYSQTPEKFSALMGGFASAGLLNLAGGCCGTGPAHIKALAAAVKGVRPRAPKAEEPWVISGTEALFFDEIEPPAMAGERNNSIGSKKFRDMVAAGDRDGALALARAQAAAGAHLLDVCLANPERDELADVKDLFPALARAVRLPLMIDTTDPAVMEEALKSAAGKSVINSVNFEFGPDKPRAAAELVKIYGAKLVVGCIDEDKEKGLPLESGRKLEIARRAHAFLTGECGLKPADLIFDALVFPVGVGGEHAASAHETIKAIEGIKKEFPGVKTILGVSNVSFGLPPASREVLNSVFLHHAVKAGLDLAIVNIEKLRRYSAIPENERAAAEDLVFARRPDAAQAFAALYRDARKRSAASAGDTIRHGVPVPVALPPGERLKASVLGGSRAGVPEAVAELLASLGPLDIINGPLMEAMKEVGRQFAAGDLIVTEVLQSAEAARAAVIALEPALKAQKAPRRGRLLLATVRGDVHDIGKNLVGIIFESNGFEVEDLGVKVPPEEIAAAAVKNPPDFIGLSGLLVRSCEQMAATARELAAAGVKAPLLVGGAALTPRFTENGIAPAYGGPVFYAADAMEGLNYALALAGSAAPASSPEPAAAAPSPAVSSGFTPSPLYYPGYIPVPRDLDRHFVGDQPLSELFDNLDTDLFNLRFLKLKKGEGEKSGKAKELFDSLKAEVLRGGLIKPRGVYRFFRVNSHGDEIRFRGGESTEVFRFPRQTSGRRLCLADYIAPESGGKDDHAALFAVTCGLDVTDLARREREAGEYVRSYMIEALALTLAEAFADVMHYRIRKDWGIAETDPAVPLLRSKYRGKRYSFGYPVCPALENQERLFRLLRPEPDAGISLTDGFMMDPEASVSAIVLHNPKAEYFNV